MRSVLSLFKDSLFSLNQVETRFSSVLTMGSMVLAFLLLYKIKLSSAKCPVSVSFQQNLKSLMYTRNNSGPSDEPWGTPQDTFLQSESKPLIETYCHLFERYD